MQKGRVGVAAAAIARLLRAAAATAIEDLATTRRVTPTTRPLRKTLQSFERSQQ